MKGIGKALARTPHMLGSKVGMSSKTTDAEFADLNRRFGGLEEAAGKLLKDSQTFRESVSAMLTSSAAFSSAFQTVFGPIGSDYDLDRKFPGAMDTVKAMSAYQVDMGELRDALVPELELIDSRILAPIKDYVDVLKRIRKAITKRDHKLVDYDRHNNSYTKLRDKKEKSLNDEKNLFKVEQDFEAATQDYEHHNNALKQELPRFFELSTAFITPLFQSFYFLQLQVLYTMLEKLQAFAGSKYDLQGDAVATYESQIGDAAEQLEALTITKRFVSTAKLMATRQGSTDTTSSGSAPSRSASGSISRPAPTRLGSGGLSKPPLRSTPPGSAAAAPPPYSAVGASSTAAAAATAGKRAPPPPPAARPKPAAQFCTALYDFECQAEGDLSFNVGDRIEIVQKTASAQDWWTGKLDGRQGSFPGNYVQLE